MAQMTLNQAERRELITAMVANCAGWDEDDLDILVNMSNEKLWHHANGCAQLIANEEEDSGDLPDSLEASSADEDRSAAEGGDEEQQVSGDEGESGPSKTHPDEEKDQPKKCWDEEGNEADCPEGQADGENVTENQYLRQLPPRIQSVVINALKFEQTQKEQLVQTITANSRNRFSKNYLMHMGLDELQALSELASPKRSAQPVFVGAAGGPIHNEANIDRDDILTVPVLEFTRSSKN